MSAQRNTAIGVGGILICLLIGFYSSTYISPVRNSKFSWLRPKTFQRGSNASELSWLEYTDLITRLNELSYTQCQQPNEIQSVLKELVGLLSSSSASLPPVPLKEFKVQSSEGDRDALPKVAAASSAASKIIGLKVTSDNKDVCAEPFAYKKLNGGHPTFYKGFNMLNCTGVPAFNTLLTMVYNFVNYSSEDLPHIPRLLNSVNKVYPGIAILAALPSDSELTEAKFNDATFTKYSRNTAETDIWSQLIAKVKTKYVYIGRNVIHLTWFERLERLVREVNHLGAYAVGASFRTLRSGHWSSGCEQATLRNYTLAYEHGYRMSIHECMLCDHVEGPFVSKTQLFKEVPLKPSVTAVSGFAMWFLTLKKKQNGVTAASCPDAMSFVTDDSELPTNKTHWINLAKALQVEKIYPPGSPKIEFNCDEAVTHCSVTKRKGMALSHCCLRRLSEANKLVMKLCLENGFLCEVISGTLLGAVKLNGVLPWEIDGDYVFEIGNYTHFEKLRPEFVKRGFSLIKHGGAKLIRHRYYYVQDKNWFVEVFTYWAMDSVMLAKQGLSPTYIYYDGMYIATAASPGLHARNRYGPGSLQHVQHWRHTGKKTSWALYTTGTFSKCPIPGHHACLDQFVSDGVLQFRQP